MRELVEGDYVAAKRESLVKQAGYQVFDWHERSALDRHVAHGRVSNAG